MKYLAILFLAIITLQGYSQEHITPTDQFRVTGEVKNELTLTMNDLLYFRQNSLGDVVVQMHYGATQKDTLTQLKGVLLKDILDSAGITAAKHKAYNNLVIVLTATDGYTNIYSWNELYNTDIGNHVYIITGINGVTIEQMPQRIAAISLSDLIAGRRHIKALQSIKVVKME